MRRFFWIRLRMFLRRCAGGGIVMAGWFAFGTAAFHILDGLPLPRALAVALYVGYTPSPLWELYSFWGQCVLFGIVISVFLLQAVQQYNPQEACRMLAKEMKDHAVVIGYTHLGQRIVDYLRQAKRPYVLIDRDPTAVDDLVRLPGHGDRQRHRHRRQDPDQVRRGRSAVVRARVPVRARAA